MKQIDRRDLEDMLAKRGMNGDLLRDVPLAALAEFVRVLDDMQERLRDAGAGPGAQRFAEAADEQLYSDLGWAARGLEG
jgi:hypothetical protein